MQATELLKAWPAARWAHRKLLVGVSGGADSVALLLALSELAGPGQLVAAHFNHGWRGAESDGDQQFVAGLCRQHRLVLLANAAPGQPPASRPQSQTDFYECVGTAMHAKVFSAVTRKDFESFSAPRPADGSVRKSEDVAREARYRFLVEAAYEIGASYVVTAHTADDRVETLLHNIFRGTGLSGAASLRQFRKLDADLVLARPLVARTRDEVLQYLRSRDQSYRLDSSNADLDFARNYVRSELLPAVRRRYPGVDANLLRFSELVEEALVDVERLADDLHARVEADLAAGSQAGLPEGWRRGDYWLLPVRHAAAEPWTVLRAALRRVWLERGWPMREMDRGRWQSLRGAIESSCSPPPANIPSDAATPGEQLGVGRGDQPSEQRGGARVLLVLPGEVRVELGGGMLAIGRPAPRTPRA